MANLQLVDPHLPQPQLTVIPENTLREDTYILSGLGSRSEPGVFGSLEPEPLKNLPAPQPYILLMGVVCTICMKDVENSLITKCFI